MIKSIDRYKVRNYGSVNVFWISFIYRKRKIKLKFSIIWQKFIFKLNEKCSFILENGGWGEWLKWSPCSVSCGQGVRKAHRFCDSPIPKYGGAKCVGDSVKEESCNDGPCPSKSDL